MATITRVGDYRLGETVTRFGRNMAIDDPEGISVEDLLPGVQHYESGGKRYAISPKGAIGLYQIMPGTAQDYGYSREDMFDPTKNRDVATKYLSKLLSKYNGNAYMALAAYNTGERNVDRGILPPETTDYVHNVLNYVQGFGRGKTVGTRAAVAGRDITPRMDLTGPIDPSFRGMPLSQIFNRYGRITGDQPGYGGEQSLQTLPQRFDPIGDIRAGYNRVMPALGQLFSPVENAISRIGNYFSRTPVQAISGDPGETI